ncbi:unnamed protein product [Closterium sp. NIES-53]
MATPDLNNSAQRGRSTSSPNSVRQASSRRAKQRRSVAAEASESRSDAAAAGPDHYLGLHAEVQTDYHWSHRLHRRHHLHRLHLLYRCPHCHAHCHLHHHRCLLHYPGHRCPCCCGASY